MATTYTVRQGDCLSSIAARHGLPWKAIWENPANAQLRSLRGDPNILLPGDVLTIPDPKPKQAGKGTGAKHTFKVTAPPPELNLRLLNPLGQGIANQPFTLELDDGKVESGSTDGDGKLKAKLGRQTETAKLTLTKLGAAIPIRLGALDPIDTVSGVQARLNQLGYSCGPVDGIVGPLTKAGTRAFQKAYSLAVDGIIGPQTRGKLLEVFGS